MAFIPTPDMALAVLNYQDVNGILAVQRFYCGATNPITLEDLQEIGQALYDVWVAQIAYGVVNEWALASIVVKDASEEEGLLWYDDNEYPVPGAVASVAPPANQVSYTVTWNTGYSGRSARGRTYGVGLDNGYHDGHRLTDVGQGILQSEWELFRLAMITAGHAINVVSFQEGGVLREEGRPLPAISCNVRFPLATQRRRLS